jgi:hypothetical protein
VLIGMQDLENMWCNASSQLKPGGKLVSARAVGNFQTDHALSGKYGISISDLATIPGGIEYQVHCHTKPPFQFGGHLLDRHADLSDGINHRNGLGDLELMNPKETEVVKKDWAFWADFLEEPFMIVTVANKSSAV